MALWNVRDEDRRTGCRGAPSAVERRHGDEHPEAFEPVEGSREPGYLRRKAGVPVSLQAREDGR